MNRKMRANANNAATREKRRTKERKSETPINCPDCGGELVVVVVETISETISDTPKPTLH